MTEDSPEDTMQNGAPGDSYYTSEDNPYSNSDGLFGRPDLFYGNPDDNFTTNNEQGYPNGGMYLGNSEDFNEYAGWEGDPGSNFDPAAVRGMVSYFKFESLHMKNYGMIFIRETAVQTFSPVLNLLMTENLFFKFNLAAIKYC